MIELKHSASLPHHKMLELVTVHFEVDTKVIHDGDVISELLGCGKMGEPATLLTFREDNPSTPWGRCSHRSSVFLRVERDGAEAWGRREQDVRQGLTSPPGLSRKNERGRTRIKCKFVPR